MCLALVALLLVVDLGPEGMPLGFSSPLYKRLSQALRTLEAPVDPGLFAAAFRGHVHADARRGQQQDGIVWMALALMVETRLRPLRRKRSIM